MTAAMRVMLIELVLLARMPAGCTICIKTMHAGSDACAQYYLTTTAKYHVAWAMHRSNWHPVKQPECPLLQRLILVDGLHDKVSA